MPPSQRCGIPSNVRTISPQLIAPPADSGPTFRTCTGFISENPQYLAENNALPYMSDDGGASYNLCHFWSNFEIANMDFWRGEAYSKYFDYLDATGGFYYEVRLRYRCDGGGGGC